MVLHHEAADEDASAAETGLAVHRHGPGLGLNNVQELEHDIRGRA